MTWGEFNVKVQDYAIGGKMLAVAVQIDDIEMMSVMSNEKAKEMMRSQLAYQLADAMIKEKLIEITQMPDPTRLGHRITARCYLAPDETIKVLRRIV